MTEPAISICLLNDAFFKDTQVPHHRFRLYDREQNRDLGDMVELHTVELPKYNLLEATISKASKIEQWAFFLLKADQYDSEELRALLPGVEFDQAITVIERISQKTEDRMMYDQREKAMRDHQWIMEGAREEGREEGREQGREEGREGLVDTVITLQGIAGDPALAVDELQKLDIDELNRLCANLRDRLRSRGNS